jgi:hypothetical protein
MSNSEHTLPRFPATRRAGLLRAVALIGTFSLMAAGAPVKAATEQPLQPLPGSLHSAYFLFKLASSLQLADTETAQCTASASELQQSADLQTSHSFVLSESLGDLKAVVDEYVLESNFTPVTDWNVTDPVVVSRRFADPQVPSYRYAVDLYPLKGDSTAMCVSVLGSD